MRAPLVRTALLLVAALLPCAAACGGGSDDEAAAARPATPAPPPSSTPSVSAERTPEPTPDLLSAATASPTSTAAPSVPTPPPWPAHHPAGTRTGVAQVDAVIAALEARDVDALVALALALVQERECVLGARQPGIGAPVCADGEQLLTPVRVFPSSRCELGWLREAELRDHLERFTAAVAGLSAVVELQEPASARVLGAAAPWDRLVALTVKQEGAPGFASGQALLLAGAAVVATNAGCTGPRSYLTWGGEPPVLLLPPPEP
jgi:hypothetical protein